MNTEQQQPSLTLSDQERAEIEAKCLELAKEKKVAKVHPYVAIRPEDGERIIAYVSEPNYQTKLHLMDKAVALGQHAAAEEYREMCLIREASHPLTYANTPDADPYKLGVVAKCLETITMVMDVFKKK